MAFLELFAGLIALLLASFLAYRFMTHQYFVWLRFHYLPITLNSENLGIQPYYALYPKLSDGLKKKFRWRAFYFLYTTNITFKEFEGYSTNDQQKVRHLLASVAAQMTLFLPIKCFLMIHTIIVYPKAYYSTSLKQYHKGETNPAAGIIALSWTGIAEGLQSPVDGINLIIHEYAHALWVEHVATTYKTFEPEAADRFKEVAKKELALAAEAETHFFRDYGLTNFHEFLAVAAENFFERPGEFKKQLPEVYDASVALYQQDPSSFT